MMKKIVKIIKHGSKKMGFFGLGIIAADYATCMYEKTN